MNNNLFTTQKPLPTAQEGYRGRGYITNEEINEINNYNNQELKDFIIRTVRDDKILVDNEEKEANDLDNANETEYDPIQTTILNMLSFLTKYSQSQDKNKISNNEKMIIINMLNLYIYRNANNILSSINKRKRGYGGKSKKHRRSKKTRKTKTKRRHHKK